MKIYTCEACGNVLIVRNQGTGHPECCGRPMSASENNDVFCATDPKEEKK